jgi:hypothetical protein
MDPGTGHDRDPGLPGALVQAVKRAEHLQLVADVEVVHSGAEAGFGERGCRVQERARGVEYEMHAVQRGSQRGWVLQGHCPVLQAEVLGQRGDGRRASSGRSRRGRGRARKLAAVAGQPPGSGCQPGEP